MSAARPKHTREEGPSIWPGVNIDLAGPRCKEGIIGTHKEDRIGRRAGSFSLAGHA